MKFKTILLFGAPGSGKGTLGKIIGTIPGFFHSACGDVFRSLNLNSRTGRIFMEYSSKGQLVPDAITIEVWTNFIKNMVALERYKPDLDYLVLDGIPRNIRQAEMLQEMLQVDYLFHLVCPDRNLIYERLRRRALKENRFDDASDEIIAQRLATYEKESKPVLDFYPREVRYDIDATQWPYQVLRDILCKIKR